MTPSAPLPPRRFIDRWLSLVGAGLARARVGTGASLTPAERAHTPTEGIRHDLRQTV